MKPSFHVETSGLMREAPPRSAQIPCQALGAKVEIEKELNHGMFVRSVCLSMISGVREENVVLHAILLEAKLRCK